MSHIKSFDDLGNKGSDSDDDGGDFNDYYAGGEKSGQLIRGAPNKKDDDEDRVGALFNRARQAGAVQGSADDLDEPKAAFTGTGRTLAGGSTAAPPAEGPISHVITFYRNAIFTVNDGPARRVDDPANMAFIASISKGECPEELEPPARGTPINVNLMRKDEDYTEPDKPKMAAFQGSGRTLGSSTAAGAGGASTSAANAIAASDGEWAGVNESAPTTSLQLRLADGSRMVARFNHTHTVADIRRFIRASRPDITFAYSLMSGVPPQPISDESQSIEAAGLLNAVIIQRK